MSSAWIDETVAVAKRSIRELQAKIDIKQEEIRLMREAAAQGRAYAPTQTDKTDAMRQLLRLQQEHKRAAQVLEPKPSSITAAPTTPGLSAGAVCGDSTGRKQLRFDSEHDLDAGVRVRQQQQERQHMHRDPESRIDAAQDQPWEPKAGDRHVTEVRELRAAVQRARERQAGAERRLKLLQETHAAEMERCAAASNAVLADFRAEMCDLERRHAAELRRRDAEMVRRAAATNIEAQQDRAIKQQKRTVARRRLRAFMRTMVSATRALRSLEHAVTEKQEQIRRCREAGAAPDVQQQLVKELVHMKMRHAHATAKLQPPASPDAKAIAKRRLDRRLRAVKLQQDAAARERSSALESRIGTLEHELELQRGQLRASKEAHEKEMVKLKREHDKQVRDLLSRFDNELKSRVALGGQKRQKESSV